MLINKQKKNWCALIVFIIGISLRFIYLDADPYYYAWAGYVTDEGRWNECVRNWYLFGLIPPYIDMHFVISPLFQFANYLFYLLLDINRFTSRLFPAICGSTVIIIFYLHLRYKVAPHALILGISLLASQADLVMLSRVSVPEIAVMLFELLIFFTIITEKYTPYNMVIAGFLMLIGIGMKATVFPFLAIFSIIILTIPSLPSVNKGCYYKLKNLFFFWTGPFIIISLTGILIFCHILNFEEFFSLIIRVLGFIRLNSLFGFFSFPFEHVISPTFNIWALGLWISIISWTGVSKNDETFVRNNRILVASCTWFVLFFVMMQSLSYYPERYKVHILIPMAVIITTGISLFQQVGIIKVVESFTKGKSRSQIFRIFILTFPTSVFISPLLIFILGQFLPNSDRLLYKVSCIAFLSFITLIIVDSNRVNKNVISFFLVFPIIAGAGWQILWAFSDGSCHFWIDSTDKFHTASWTFILLITSFGSVFLAFSIYRQSPAFLRRTIVFASIFYLTISIIRIFPGYVNPRYSIKNISSDLGALLSDSSFTVNHRAEGLFIDNNLLYNFYLDPGQEGETNKLQCFEGFVRSRLPEYIVTVFKIHLDKTFIQKNYRPIKKYNLYLSPEYLLNYPEIRTEVIVYKRRKNEFSGKNIMR